MNGPESVPSEQSATQPVRMPYLPGLDGLRALAVIAVLLYHADQPVWGGYLGVEVFFVLSGFLITALLLGEQRHHERIDLVAFWMRRARRLLPALVVVLAGTLAIAAALPASETSGLGGAILAAIGYVMNWHLVLGGQSYFDAGVRPSLLQHLWSLAVEEQFYLLWPLLVVAGLRLLRTRGLLVATLLGAVASALLAALLYEPGADPSRIYYGTDTRASGLLIGAALALCWAPWRSAATARRRAGLALDIAGCAGLAGLALAALWLFDQHPLLYRGGLTMVALTTALVIMAATHPRARLLPALLAWAPLRWIGQRSYGIYLWHWPIFQITRPYSDVPLDGVLLLALRVGATVLLAALSFWLVEEPVRRGALGRLWGHIAAPTTPLRDTLRRAGRAVAYRAAAWRRPRPAFADRPAHVAAYGRRLMPRRQRLALLFASGAMFASAACASLTLPADAPAQAATSNGGAADTDASQAPAAVPPSEAAADARPAPRSAVAPTPAAEPGSSREMAADEAQAFDADLGAALQAALDRAVADGAIPGAVATVSVPGHETWAGASGLANRAKQTAMAPETRVLVGSLSKLFTAVLVMRLVDEGRLSLDDPLATWLPDAVPDAEAIKVRHLLQHTSGLHDYLEDRRFVAEAYKEPGRQFEPRELVAYAAKFPATFAPGDAGKWSYSSTNYVLLGLIVEAVTGNTLATEMRARIFEPLGLRHTYFAPDEAVEGPLATGYARSTPQGRLAMSFGFATANLVSTADDLHTFAQALFAGDLVSDGARKEMLTFVEGNGEYNMPQLAYGLGVMRNVLPTGYSEEQSGVIGHIGGFGGFRAAVWHAPASGITIALSVNQGSTDPNKVAADLLATALASRAQNGAAPLP